MGIENLKRWHWIAIGLVLGLVLAYSRLWVGNDSGEAGRSLGQTQFEWGLHAPAYMGQYPVITDIVVYPEESGVTLIRMMRREPRVSNPRELVYEPWIFRARRPYKPQIPAKGGRGWGPWGRRRGGGGEEEEGQPAQAEGAEAKGDEAETVSAPGDYTVRNYLDEVGCAQCEGRIPLRVVVGAGGGCRDVDVGGRAGGGGRVADGVKPADRGGVWEGAEVARAGI